VTLRLLPRIRAALTPTRVAALAVFAVALGLRLVWVARVDSPFDNIHSDMAGYINRARQAAYGAGDPFPIFATLYPPGAHLVYAAEMKLVGWTHHGPLLFLNCLWGAVVAPCTMLLALRIVPRLPGAVGLGLLAAAWYPVLAFAGFFSSEQPYAGAIALSAWLLVRQVESGKGAVALGVVSAVAYLVRPQIILTLAVLTLLGLFVLWRRPPRAPRLRVGRLVLAGAILTAAVAFGAVRYHSLSGRWGLISDNSAMTRLWADTSYGEVRSTSGFFFSPPPKVENGETRRLLVDGYVGDPVLLDRARRNEVQYMSLGERVVRWVRNVRFLFVNNQLWPDAEHVDRAGWRRAWYGACWNLLLVVLCPLTVLGMASCFRRPTVVLVVCTAHVLTMLVVAAFFFAEARYRVPYDIFLMLLSLEGARWAAEGARRLSSRLRRGPLPVPPTPP
jgi:hypothetical protein